MRSVELNERLFLLSDEKFKKLNSSLIPNIDPEYIIGVKTPQLKSLAKELYKSDNYKEFLLDLPHKYFEENQIHAFVIAEIKDFDKCIIEVECFLPHIDNWATCDQLSPKVFIKHKTELIEHISRWINSCHTYTVRFAVNMLMRHFLEDNFRIIYADMVAAISIDDYYVNMVRAWYFATALAKQRESVLPYLVDKKLDVWTHNKTIQKSLESLRISKEQKEYLKTLKIETG